MQIEKIFVVSTAHVPETVYRALEKHSAMSRKEGDLVYIGDNQDEPCDVELLHKNICQLSHLARQEGCCWLLFDRDGDQVESVSTFDW